MQIEIKPPYLLFLGDEPERSHAKTAVGIAHWRRELCVGQLRLPGSGVDLGLPDVTPAEAAAEGVQAIIARAPLERAARNQASPLALPPTRDLKQVPGRAPPPPS